MAQNKRSDRNLHIPDEVLLLALDGELSAREATQVDVHIKSCWSCRSRCEQVKEAMGDVVEYRDRLTLPYLPLPVAGRSNFLAKLEQIAISDHKPPLWKRALRFASLMGAIPKIRALSYVWVGALILMVLGFVSFSRLTRVAKVSASEVLDNAQASESREIQRVAMPVVYQKLSIRLGSQTVTRTIYRDPIGKRQADQLEVIGASGEKISSNVRSRGRSQMKSTASENAGDALKRTFLSSNLHWEDPLSPANYNAWYKGLDSRKDEVTTGGSDFVTIKTTTSRGPIAEGRITLRTIDFHPVAEYLTLLDGRQLEVQELAWEVLPMDAINMSIFEPDPGLSKSNTGSTRRVSSLLESPVATDSELAEAELRARIAIHAENADLGEPVELDRESSILGRRSVVVRGIVGSVERRNDLYAALEGIPHVEFRVGTLEVLQPQQDQTQADNLLDSNSQIEKLTPAYANPTENKTDAERKLETSTIVITGWPALEQRLEERFPIAEKRTAFVNDTVELIEDTMAHAWALRRLTERYTPDSVAELSSGSQQTLELLIRDHVSVVRQEAEDIRIKILPLLSPSLIPVIPPAVVSESSLSAPVSNNWRDSVMSVFAEVQKINDNGRALLAGPREEVSDPRAVISELRQVFAEMELQLPALSQQVSGQFSGEIKNAGK